jgi:NAD(P)-dependent dehydrogenase (short-subunit alcohol dehydrogenase family)
MMRLKDRVAIVTGAASGIGRAIAQVFAREGAKVVVADIDAAGGRETVKLITAQDGEALFLPTDVSVSGEARGMVERTIRSFESLHILVNNAAYLKDFKAAVDTTEEEWDFSIDVTLKGVFLCSKFAIPEMIRAGGGSIINIASVGGLVGFASYAAYCSAKGGVIQLTKSLAIDYGRHNIRVNAICPGPIDTPTTPEAQDEKLHQWQRDMTVLGRTASPEEVAYPALFLASEESSFVTGSNLVVDGGWTIR